MITKNTVLILGAGASMPFGFPSGIGLRNEILKHLGVSTAANWKHDFKHSYGILKEDTEKFYNSYLKCGGLSIDSFIENRPEFEELGKLCIAKVLISKEGSQNLFNMEDNTDHWYSYLVSKLNIKEKFGLNNLSIITFNYDRSLEHYLFNTLKENNNIDDDKKCADLFNQINFVHVYGQLGYLTWQNEINNCGYNMDTNKHKIQNAAEEIKLIFDRTQNSATFDKAKNLIMDAKLIVFLGFGFDKTNLERLGFPLKNVQPQKRIIGTVYGLGLSEISSINNNFGTKLSPTHKEMKTLEFLKEYVNFE